MSDSGSFSKMSSSSFDLHESVFANSVLLRDEFMFDCFLCGRAAAVGVGDGRRKGVRGFY